jgi:iron(III) transport system permease protein
MRKKIIIMLVLLVFILPGIYIFYRAISPIDSSQTAQIHGPILVSLVCNSLTLAFLGSLLAALIGFVCAATVLFYDFPFRSLLESVLCLPLAIPSYLVAAIYKDLAHEYFMFGFELENIWGASLVFAFTLYPYFYILLKTAIQSQSSVYIETGKSLGLGPVQRFVKILVPMARPAMILGSILVGMEIMSDYATASLLGQRTITTGIYTALFSANDPVLAARLSMFLYLLPLCAILIATLSRRRVSVVNPPNRSSGVTRSPLKVWGVLCLTFSILIPLFAGFIFPVFTLVRWIIGNANIMGSESIFSDVFNTVSTGFLVVVSCIAVSLFFSNMKRKPGSKAFADVASRIINAQFVLPGIVVAISLLFITSTIDGLPCFRWFTRTSAIIVFACVIRFVCFSSFSIDSGMKRIMLRYEEVSSTLGMRKVSAFMTLRLPLLKRSLVVGGILVFICAAKELTMALVLQPFDFSTLSIRLYSFARMDFLKDGALSALFLILIVLYPVLSMNKWMGLEEKV